MGREALWGTKDLKGSGAKPKRERTPREVAALAKFAARNAEGAPRLKAIKDGDRSRLAPDHPDETVGHLLLMEALGTTDFDFYHALLGQFANVGSQGRNVDEGGTNFMLAVVKGIQPRDQIEAMLATQMAAVHAAMMTFARRLNHVDNLQQQDSAERAFNKLARTFASQMEALKRYRTGGEQKVTVQHVTVGEGGQAIVGNVTQGQREPAAVDGAAPAPLALSKDKTAPMKVIEGTTQPPFRFGARQRKNDRRSSTPYRADAVEPALRRQDPLRQALQGAGGRGQEALPHAWRGGGIGGSPRQQKMRRSTGSTPARPSPNAGNLPN